MLDHIDSPEQLKALSLPELSQLAGEIRQLLVDAVSRHGGHLASNLGMVELTLALHCVFDCPEDKLVFDVGHQAYVHKILTGRREQLSGGLREQGGISGFPRSDESPYDAYDTGHASTAISAALGMARARVLMGQRHAVVAVVGDGALTGGMCYEALNDAGHSQTPLIVILNDNGMSISRNVGALSAYLTRLRQSTLYRDTKRAVKHGLSRIPVVGRPLHDFIDRVKRAVKHLFVNGQFFEALGFEYQGPIDGHDLKRLIRVLERAKDTDHPVLLHVVTQKGRGYLYAENHPESFHGTAPFYVDTGEPLEHGDLSNGRIMAHELCALAETDCRIVALTAAMPSGTGLTEFQERFPERFFDVGIAEEHAVALAAGMAASGLRPYFAVYSSFLQRAYDQILEDVCLQGLPVTLMVDRAGLVGPDGATHQGVFDLSYLRQMPGLAVASPRDTTDLKRLIQLSHELSQPMAIRYAKSGDDLGAGMANHAPLKLGEWETLLDGSDVIILAVGRMVKLALRASIELAGKRVSCGVVDARFVKPMDEALLRRTAQSAPLLVTLEDNVVAGGFGAGVMETLSEWGIDCDLMALGVPDRFVEHASVGQQLEACGLTPLKIAQTILNRKEHAHGQ